MTATAENAFQWWQHGVLYQIYPRSFRDSNGDGIGDLQGIIDSLDYLRFLGVDGIWLSPVFPSPLFDFGYDVSDYCSIAPEFGSLSDAKRLVSEAHRRGIRVIFDLVVNHTSHLHPWFIESSSSRDNPKHDWYIWHDGKKGGPPNNWLAAFGGRGWDFNEGRGQWYYHAFLREQPDLNWFNPGVRQAVFAILDFWFNLGIDGFRLDVINYYAKDPELRNNPWGLGPTPRPYDLQRHDYDRDRPELYPFLRELRNRVNSWPGRMLVGEAYTPPPGDPRKSAACLGNGSDMLHLAFDFSLVYEKRWRATRYLSHLESLYRAVPRDGWPALVLGNHDQARLASRLGGGIIGLQRSTAAAALLLFAKGTPFMYYGDEIGMENGRLAREVIVDPAGKKYWPFFKGRDPFRTPMQWDSARNSGFSQGKPWLPVNSDYREKNVDRMISDPRSLLSRYRDMIALRKRHVSLTRGEFIPWLTGNDDVVAFYRTLPEETTAVVINFSSGERRIVSGTDSPWTVVYGTADNAGVLAGLNCTLAPGEVLVLRA